MKKKYDVDTELLLKRHYSGLPEKSRRHYAAVEAIKLGSGGKTYISTLFCLTRVTLNKGISELNSDSLYAEIPVDKQRRSGGGRKKFCP